MAERTLRKLKALILESDVDAVVESLGEAGIVQFINMPEKLGVDEGIVVSHIVSTEALKKCSDLLSRIEISLEHLGFGAEGLPSEAIPVTKEPIEKVLAEAEQKLAEMPIETLTKCLALASRINQLIEALGLELEEEKTEHITLEKPATEVLAEAEQKLAEIEETTETAGLIDSQALMEKTKTLAFGDKVNIGRKLFELRKSTTESKRFFEHRLLTLKELVGKVRESIEIDAKLEDVRQELRILRKTVEKEKHIAEEEEKFVKTARTVYFEAWVPKYHVKKAIETIDRTTGGNCVVADEPPDLDEKMPIVPPPVPKYIIAFEKLVYAFGYPSYGDVNPIRVFAITFPILFGIMFADVGQGAIFILTGVILALYRRRVKPEEAGDIIRYLLISSEMFIFLGISAILFGFIFGEFFGPSGVIHPIFLGRIGPFYIGGFEPTQEPMKMLRFAILVGTIHISIGLILKIVNEIRHKHHKLATIPICWLWLLWGSLFMWVFWGGISNISKWFGEGNLMLAGLIILPLVLILGVTARFEGFMEGVGFTVEVFAETLSHSMSYGRLMALGLIHSAMNYMFLVLGGVEHGHFPLESIPVIATGTILVMIIEGLVVFVHTIRLHWVEWFSKFHKGEGIPFKPFEHK